MMKLYFGLVLAVEAVVIGLLWVVASDRLVLMLLPILPLSLVVALLLYYVAGNPGYRARRLSPEAIVGYRSQETQAETPEELSRRIVERADEIHRTLLESPSEVQIEMCTLGYRACVNDMITLTNLINEESKTAGPIRRLRLNSVRKRATDSLSVTREAMPPGALRATHQEQQ
ncbi:MAG: hypothetical protein LC751_00445 [Actinobacteria bacterium]|jgi:hypothetical protein|nr:hypothetical protein [Actinomycetota bacterium]MCA1737754.1 hypothetical protein [Actinomycetota bacterium]